MVEREAERVEEGWRWLIKEQVDVFETALIRDVGIILSETRSNKGLSMFSVASRWELEYDCTCAAYTVEPVFQINVHSHTLLFDRID